MEMWKNHLWTFKDSFKILNEQLRFRLTHGIPVSRICATANEIHRGCSFRQVDLHSSVAILLWFSEKRVWKRECTVLWYQRIAWPKTVDSDERYAQRQYYYTEGSSHGTTCPLQTELVTTITDQFTSDESCTCYDLYLNFRVYEVGKGRRTNTAASTPFFLLLHAACSCFFSQRNQPGYEQE